MKRTGIILAFVLMGWWGCSRAPSSDGFFVPLKPSLTKLPNGMEVMVLEDHEFPTLEMQITVRGGSVYDPPGKEGLAAVALHTVRLGGAEGRDPRSIEEDLEFVGASLEVEVKPEILSATLSLLKKDADLGLDILFDLFRRPALDPAQFAVVKERAKDEILRDLEDPLKFASREFRGLVYGLESPWGRKATPGSIDNIAREDVLDFCRKFLHPDRILVAVSGDFSEEEILEKLRKRTEGWEKSSSALPEIAAVKAEFRKEAFVASRNDLTQSTVILGHLGAKRENQDKFALLVMNFILGGSGSLTSRMGEEIRSSAGKAYGVWSDFGFGRDLGVFRAVAQTALENTNWVTKKMQEMITSLSQGGVTAEETLAAKRAILRALVFGFETRFAQVKEQARFRLWGFPDDYLVQFQKRIAAVTPEDVWRVAKKYLHPEGLKVLVVTDEKTAETLDIPVEKLP